MCSVYATYELDSLMRTEVIVVKMRFLKRSSIINDISQ